MSRLFYLFFLISIPIFGQNLQLKISGGSTQDNNIIDSVGYNKKHLTAKLAVDEANLFLLKLSKVGYLTSTYSSTQQINDSVFEYKCDVGKRTDMIHIYIDKDYQKIAGIKDDSITLPISENENFINSILKKYESIGYALVKAKLINLKNKDNFITAQLKIEPGKKRQLNDIIINGYAKFPLGHLKNLNRLYKKKVFNIQNLEQLQKNIDQYRFVRQIKNPEILFTKDSTKIYVYVEKANTNAFDGFLGFTNDDKKNILLSGYVDLKLNNIINNGEKLVINWRSNGQEQSTFNAGIELPYIFNSPIGIKANLNIIKQDSTFQTTQTALDLGYFFNYNTRLYIGYQSSESSYIKNLNTALISDFTNTFITTNFEYLFYKNEYAMFPEKTAVNLKIGAGNRNSKFQNDTQFFANLQLKHDLYINQKNCINLKSQSFYLQSNSYIINELYRFGGINSVRGFNENTLQGNLFTSILTEYRYLVNSNLYVHSILDYGVYQDKTVNTFNKLFGVGFGFGLLTKNGLFNLVYANGTTKDQEFKLANSLVQISLKASF